MTGELVEVSGLTVDFPVGERTVRAVDDLSFTLAPGAALGIVGESGSGKSTVASALLGLHHGTGARVAGSVSVAGIDVQTAGPSGLRRLRGGAAAMVFQDPLSSLDPYYAIGDQLAEVYRVHRDVSRRAARQRAVEVLDRVGIPDAARRSRSRPHEFSGGMRQRALIAMALICEPRLLVADEPTTALDVTVQAQILDLLHDLRTETGLALLLVTHDLGVIAGSVDTVLVMRAGRVVERGPVTSILTAPAERYTRALLEAVPRVDASLPRGGLPASPGGGVVASPGGGVVAAPGGGVPASPGGGLVAAPGGGVPAGAGSEPSAAPRGDLPVAPGGGSSAGPGGEPPVAPGSGSSAAPGGRPSAGLGSEPSAGPGDGPSAAPGSESPAVLGGGLPAASGSEQPTPPGDGRSGCPEGDGGTPGSSEADGLGEGGRSRPADADATETGTGIGTGHRKGEQEASASAPTRAATGGPAARRGDSTERTAPRGGEGPGSSASREGEVAKSPASRGGRAAEPFGSRGEEAVEPPGLRVEGDTPLPVSRGGEAVEPFAPRDREGPGSSASREGEVAKSPASREGRAAEPFGPRGEEAVEPPGFCEEGDTRLPAPSGGEGTGSSASSEGNVAKSHASREGNVAKSHASREGWAAEPLGSRGGEAVELPGLRDGEAAGPAAPRGGDVAESAAPRGGDAAEPAAPRAGDVAESAARRGGDVVAAGAPPGGELLVARGVSRVFGPRRGRVVAVGGVDLAVGAGEAVGVVGESGSGKTTLGRMLVGLLEPSAGELRYQGRRLRGVSRARQMVFQDPVSSLNPRRSIGESIADPLRAAGERDEKAIHTRVRDMLERVGLDPDAYHRYPHEFSGGQRQRVGIARALVPEPRLLVCDEPVSALDVTTQAQVLALLSDLRRELGLALVFIAHDLAVVRQVSDRVVVMREGRIVEEGPVAQVYDAPQDPYTKALLAAVPVLDPEQAADRRTARRALRELTAA